MTYEEAIASLKREDISPRLMTHVMAAICERSIEINEQMIKALDRVERIERVGRLERLEKIAKAKAKAAT